MISIVTSLYKSERHLPSFISTAEKVHRKLASLNLSFEHIIIANDMSAEEKRLLESCSAHFTIVLVPRESFYASWNRGIRESSGDVFTSWNVDDVRNAEAIQDGLAMINAGYEAVYFPFRYKRYIRIFGAQILVRSTIINPPDYTRTIFMKEMHAGPFFMVRKDVFSRVGSFDEAYRIAGDFEWWSRAAKTGLKAGKCPTLAGIFYNDGKTLSGSKNVLQQEENKRAVQNS